MAGARRQASGKVDLAIALRPGAASRRLSDALALVRAGLVASVLAALYDDMSVLTAGRGARPVIGRPDHLSVMLAASPAGHLVLDLSHRAQTRADLSADLVGVRPAPSRSCLVDCFDLAASEILPAGKALF